MEQPKGGILVSKARQWFAATVFKHATTVLLGFVLCGVPFGCQSSTPRMVTLPRRPPLPPAPLGVVFRIASEPPRTLVVAGHPSYGPAWAVNELPLQEPFRILEQQPPFSPWLILGSVMVPTNRVPLRMSIEFLDTNPSPAWIGYCVITNDGFITQQPLFFGASVNVDSATNGIRVMTD